MQAGFSTPLLIGGATTSRAHTAIKIAPRYSHPVVHVLDASRAVGVCSTLRPDGRNRSAFIEENLEAQDKARRQYESAQSKPASILAIAEARRLGFQDDWDSRELSTPSRMGIEILESFPLEALVPYIDWSPFFWAWQLHGVYPTIFNKPEEGKEAKKLFADGQEYFDHTGHLGRSEFAQEGIDGYDTPKLPSISGYIICLLYTSDAADE